MTEQCDAQRFYRCAATDALWLGFTDRLARRARASSRDGSVLI
jgi:hypothetical protein